MTEIVAIVRRSAAAATRTALERIGCAGYTVFPVLGRGRQGGVQPGGPGVGTPGASLAFLPKMLFSIVVEDDRESETVGALQWVNQSGGQGDGKIFVLNIGECYRVSRGAPEETP